MTLTTREQTMLSVIKQMKRVIDGYKYLAHCHGYLDDELVEISKNLQEAFETQIKIWESQNG